MDLHAPDAPAAVALDPSLRRQLIQLRRLRFHGAVRALADAGIRRDMHGCAARAAAVAAERSLARVHAGAVKRTSVDVTDPSAGFLAVAPFYTSRKSAHAHLYAHLYAERARIESLQHAFEATIARIGGVKATIRQCAGAVRLRGGQRHCLGESEAERPAAMATACLATAAAAAGLGDKSCAHGVSARTQATSSGSCQVSQAQLAA